MLNLKLDLLQTLTLAVVLYFIGLEIRRRIKWLERLSIPAAVIAGLTSEGVDALCFTPDGRHLAIGTRDGELMLWRVADGELVRRFLGHDFGVTAVAVTAA